MGYMFDVIRFLCQNSDDHEKLSILGIESMADMSVIKSYANTIRKPNRDIPDNLLSLLNEKFINSIDVVVDVYSAVLFPNHRENMGIPELRPHDTFLDAIKFISKEKGLNLSYILNDKDVVDADDGYPLVIWRKYGNNLRIYLSIENSGFIIRYIYAEFGDKFTTDEKKGFTSIYDAVDEIDDLIKRLP